MELELDGATHTSHLQIVKMQPGVGRKSVRSTNIESLKIEAEGDKTESTMEQTNIWEVLPYEIREKIFELVDLDGRVLDESERSWMNRNGYGEAALTAHMSKDDSSLNADDPFSVKKITVHLSYFKLPPLSREHLPALVVAFRRLPTSYNHVMEWFSRHNHQVSWSMRQITRFTSLMTKTEFNAITELTIDLWVSRIRWDIVDRKAKKLDQLYLAKYLRLLPCLKSIRLVNATTADLGLDRTRQIWWNHEEGSALRRGDWYFLTKYLTEFPFWLRGCKSIARVEVTLPCVKEDDVLCTLLDNLVQHIKAKLGVEGRILYGTLVDDSDWNFNPTKKDTWIWEAEHGGSMDWSGNLGWAFSLPLRIRVRNSFDFWHDHEWNSSEDENGSLSGCKAWRPGDWEPVADFFDENLSHLILAELPNYLATTWPTPDPSELWL